MQECHIITLTNFLKELPSTASTVPARLHILERLRCSFEAAKAAGYEKFIMFLHYPPTSIGEMESPFTLMAQEYGAEKVIYSHCHGEKRYDDSFKGYVDGIEYKLVSGDYLNFKPELVLR